MSKVKQENIKLLIDGVFFQLNNTGIARVWRSIIPYLKKKHKLDIVFLDRGGQTESIKNIKKIPFPACLGLDSAADSQLIQRICDTYNIDVFTTSYYTSPLSTPMVLMVYDMIPEKFNFDMTARFWMEKGTAINYAQRYVSISKNTEKDLLEFYPHIKPEQSTVAYCGVDTRVFKKRAASSVNRFKKRFKLSKPYFLFVGSRVQHTGYKNSAIVFDALSELNSADFDILCVGGEETIEPSILEKMPEGVQCQRVELSDAELSTAYNGALALIYPSLYEGFGMPVIEAIASNCPVITTHHGSLAEAAGDAAHLISGHSKEEIKLALEQIRDPSYREKLLNKGKEHIMQFSWEEMADTFAQEIKILHEENQSGKYKLFLDKWRHLREIQASVDY